jgi:sulfoxide reductase heme-binding subunit YedZ
MSSETLWYATRATGIMAMILMTAVVVLGILTVRRTSGRWWPAFVLQDLHKRISILSVVFLAFHILTSVLDTYVHIGWFAILVPFTSPYERFYVGLGAISFDLLLAVFISSLLRSHIGPRTWRAIHWLSYGSWPIAIAHSIGSGTDIKLGWVDGVVGLCCFAVVASATWRIVPAAQLATNGRAR